MNDTKITSRVIGGLVTDVLSALCAYPEHVEIRTKELPASTNFIVQVHARDQGKVLGQRRVTLNAILTILDALSARAARTHRLELLAPSEDAVSNDRKTDPVLAEDRTENLLRAVATCLFGSVTITKNVDQTAIWWTVAIKSDEVRGSALAELQKAFEALFSAIGWTRGLTAHVDLTKL